MEAKELRIGNFVSDIHASDSFFAEVIKLDSTRCYYGQFHSAYSDLKPIPLTEEWLLKFGFKQGDNVDFNDFFYTINIGISLLGINPNNGVVWIHRDDKIFNNPALIENVNQLQNLYFALTGEELEIKKVNE